MLSQELYINLVCECSEEKQYKDEEIDWEHLRKLEEAERGLYGLLNALDVFCPNFYASRTNECTPPKERLNYSHNFGYIHLPTHLNFSKDRVITSTIVEGAAIGMYDSDILVIGKWNGYEKPMTYISLMNKREGDSGLTRTLKACSNLT